MAAVYPAGPEPMMMTSRTSALMAHLILPSWLTLDLSLECRVGCRWCFALNRSYGGIVPRGPRPEGLQTVASRVHFREQYRALVGHALVCGARVLLLRALSVPGDTV